MGCSLSGGAPGRCFLHLITSFGRRARLAGARRREHAEYLARSIPGAEYIFLPGVSHFAPLQRPAQFNAALLDFLHVIFT